MQIQSRVEVENGDGRRESESFSTHNILKALIIIIGLLNFSTFPHPTCMNTFTHKFEEKIQSICF